MAEVAVSVASLGASLKDVRGDAEADSSFEVCAWIARGAMSAVHVGGGRGQSLPTGPAGHFLGAVGPSKRVCEHPRRRKRPDSEKKLDNAPLDHYYFGW